MSPGKNSRLPAYAIRMFVWPAAVASVWLWPGMVRADQRNLVIILANTPKAFPGSGLPPAPLANRHQVIDAYFDRFKPDIDSLAEYWYEISYHDVSVTGDVLGWVNLPWPIQPPAGNAPSSYIDLDGSGTFSYGVGESFSEGRALVIKDEETGIGPPLPPGTVTRPPVQDNFWTPGERFRDLDGDGQWDGYSDGPWVDENGDGEPTFNVGDLDGDGIPEEEFVDGNGNSVYDYREPWEDFLLRYEPDRTDPCDSRRTNWIIVYDPNCPQSGTATNNYITRNYPGNAAAVVALAGNGTYDPPESWTDRGTNPATQTTKLRPSAGSSVGTTLFPPWYVQFWTERYVDSVPPNWQFGIPRLEPFVMNATTEMPRPFFPNRGGRPDPCDPTDPDCVLGDDESPLADGAGVELPEQMTLRIIPDELPGFVGAMYDGPVEFDDLPSSIYHTGGDLRLGEITSPRSNDPYGQDIGNPFGTSPSGDTVIEPAGPLARNVHGDGGFDGGNVLTLEYLTWRRDGLSLTERQDGRGPEGGYRDFNLDGMLDQGETIPAGSVNYSADPAGVTTGLGAYPFNRDRMLEDAIAALDYTTDWDPFITGGTGNQVNTVVLYPPQAVTPVNANVPQAVSPQPVNVATFDPAAANQIRPHAFTNLVLSIGRDSEDPQANMGTNDVFASPTVAHEFGHFWEDWPDLYDYDSFNGVIVNRPIGGWDLMATGDMVHVIPPLKHHSGWIELINLASVLIPGVAQDITIPDCEFIRHRAFYVFQNPNPLRPGERYYFWSIANAGFDKRMPGNPPALGQAPSQGLMIMHTDFEFEELGNPEALPIQQRIGSHFSYNILQSDGLHQLEAGTNNGDSNDPWPGAGNTPPRTTWNNTTDPNNEWWDRADSGIEIGNIVRATGGTRVTFYYRPNVPTLTFVRPPGAESVGGVVPVLMTASDQFGGTLVKIYRESSTSRQAQTTPFHGQLLGTLTKGPGLATLTFNDNIQTLSNGDYFYYAELVPRPGGGEDGQAEPLSTTPISTGNVGGGTLTVANVAVGTQSTRGQSKLESWTVKCVNAGVEGQEKWNVQGSLSGMQTAQATTGQLYTTSGGEMQFRILTGSPRFVTGDQFVFVTTGLVNYSDPIRVQNGELIPLPTVIIDATPLSGEPPLTVNFSAAQSTDPFGSPLTFLWEFSTNSADNEGRATGVTAAHTYSRDETRTYTVRCTATNLSGGSTSRTVDIEVVACDPKARATANKTSGPPPLTVTFTSTSSDPGGGPIIHAWDFGDGFQEGDVTTATHTYQFEGAYNTVLTVTGQCGKISMVTIPINVGLTIPTVRLEASDPNPDPNENITLTAQVSAPDPGSTRSFEWTFGDGSTKATTTTNTTTHAYASEGLYRASVKVTDTNGPRTASGTGRRDIRVGDFSGGGGINRIPTVGSFVVSPTIGRFPLNVTLRATASDPDNDPLTYDLDFGDGSPHATGEIEQDGQIELTHTYTTAGTRTATIAILDDRGGRQSATQTVTVLSQSGINQAPLVVLNADVVSGGAPLTVNFSTVGTSDPEGDLVSYQWEFGDGQTAIGALGIRHTYARAGTYTATVKATDTFGAVGTASVTITVQGQTSNNNPNAVLTASKVSGVAPLTVVFSGGASTDPDGDSLTYRWDFGDGSEPVEGMGPQYIFDTAGTYIVKLTVFDGRGGQGETTRAISVLGQAPTGRTNPPTGGGDGPTTPTCGLTGAAGLVQMLLVCVGIAMIKYENRIRRLSPRFRSGR